MASPESKQSVGQLKLSNALVDGRQAQRFSVGLRYGSGKSNNISKTMTMLIEFQTALIKKAKPRSSTDKTQKHRLLVKKLSLPSNLKPVEQYDVHHDQSLKPSSGRLKQSTYMMRFFERSDPWVLKLSSAA